MNTRETKFRGKRIDNGEWAYGYYGWSMGKHYITQIVNEFPTQSDPGGCYIENTYEVIPESVGQYTGLQDKNNKDIYESDILQGKFATGIGGLSTKYKYFNFSISFQVNNNSSKFSIDCPEDVGRYRFYPYISQGEVIGNIFENTDLIHNTNAQKKSTN